MELTEELKKQTKLLIKSPFSYIKKMKNKGLYTFFGKRKKKRREKNGDAKTKTKSKSKKLKTRRQTRARNR